MDRIIPAFERTRREKRAAFVAYLCAGDPDFATSLASCRAILEAGVDVLELGVPFSDPLADGFSQVPIVFYTYYNLVFANGIEAYVRAAKEAGVDALLTLDLPPEEAGELSGACARHGVKMVFIVAPTTPDARLPKICAAATGFIYYVSREGVTGVRGDLAANIPQAVARIKAHTKLPVVVGFGISTREQVHAVAAAADGVVVGSALVNVIKAGLADRASLPARMQTVAADLVAGTR
jgi:tryptophan synthase alpha chain